MSAPTYATRLAELRKAVTDAPLAMKPMKQKALDNFKKGNPGRVLADPNAPAPAPKPKDKKPRSMISSEREVVSVAGSFYAFAESPSDESLMSWMGVESFSLEDEEGYDPYEGMELITDVVDTDCPFAVVDLQKYMSQPAVVKTHMSNNDPPSSEAISIGRTMLEAWKDAKGDYDDLKQLGKLFTMMGTNSLDSVVLASPTVVEAMTKYEDSKVRTSIFNLISPPIPEVILDSKVQVSPEHLIDPTEDGFAVHKFKVKDGKLDVEQAVDEDLTSEKRWLSFCHAAVKLQAPPKFFQKLPSKERTWIHSMYSSIMKMHEQTPYVDLGPNISFVMPHEFVENINAVTAKCKQICFREFLSLQAPSSDDLSQFRNYRKDIPDAFKDLRDPTGNVPLNEGVSVCAKWQAARDQASVVLGENVEFHTIGHSDQNRWKYVFPSGSCPGIEVDLDQHVKDMENCPAREQKEGDIRVVKVLCSDIFIEDNVASKRDKLGAQAIAHKQYYKLLSDKHYDALLVKLHPLAPSGTKSQPLSYNSLAYYQGCKIMIASYDQTRLHNMERIVLIVRGDEYESEILDEISPDYIIGLSARAGVMANWMNLVRNARLAVGCPFVPKDYFDEEKLEAELHEFAIGDYEEFDFGAIAAGPLYVHSGTVRDLCQENTKAEVEGSLSKMTLEDMIGTLDAASATAKKEGKFKAHKGVRYARKGATPGLSANIKKKKKDTK